MGQQGMRGAERRDGVSVQQERFKAMDLKFNPPYGPLSLEGI